MIDRRRFLLTLGALATTGASGQYNAKPRFGSSPFTLGVASGYPQPTGFALWTRLAPAPLAPNGGMAPEVIPVSWEVSRDEAMRNIVAHGTAYATPEWAHSVHVEVAGLQSARPHWYRFTAGDVVSPIGRAQTAQNLNALDCVNLGVQVVNLDA